MYYPSKTEFKKLVKTYNVIPVYEEIIADMDTPVSAFEKLVPVNCAFLLESIEGGERLGRYSFLGSDPFLTVSCHHGKVKIKGDIEKTIKKTKDPLKELEKILAQYKLAPLPDLPPFCGGAVGYLGYDSVRYFEDIPCSGKDDLDLPEMVFMFTDTILIFDHLKHKIKVVANAHTNGDLDKIYEETISKINSLIAKLRQSFSSFPLEEPAQPPELPLNSNISKRDFMASVNKAKQYIRDGDALQIVLSQRFQLDIKSDPFNIYRVLRTVNPSPYMYYLKFDDLELIGSSPEPLVKVEGEKVITRPIAGTRRRGKSPEEDEEMERELLSSPKEKAEHIMLVDLGRNDLGRVCEDGTVEVDDLIFVEKYSHVMHLVSQVSGTMKKDINAFDVLRAAFPAGTVSGAPKVRAMEIIDELEPTLRGPYAGVVGYFSYSGSLDTCITIRTIVVKGGKAYIQAGAGIVYDSIPEGEYKETVNKAKALLRAITAAEEGEKD